ncbi:hypothetical protein HD597_004648 [Nonomuraea thailandensis]|uniref:Uncharacterized protein n=1 Tax=Nonomuraea thailandensis TaxID=1188745 RepID=A0A9X2GNN9_9ACTN|nr:hypothetical protein [Nonomuraea thailandensis]
MDCRTVTGAEAGEPIGRLCLAWIGPAGTFAIVRL